MPGYGRGFGASTEFATTCRVGFWAVVQALALLPTHGTVKSRHLAALSSCSGGKLPYADG